MCYVWWSNDDDVYIKGCVLGKILIKRICKNWDKNEMLKGYVKVNIKMECLEDMLELVLGWY